MMTRKRVKTFNNILTCLLCKGYLIEATTINTCMHSFCRSCIVKHVKVFEKYFCPECKAEIRLSNLRPDLRLRSLIYKLIPGLHAKEQLLSCEATGRVKNNLHLLNGKHERSLPNDACSEDEYLSSQYFYDQDEPISLSLEYHMESIFGSSSAFNNIPQIRYLQAPAAFKVTHLKKFLSSKYDLSNLKKSMNIDIIYEGDVLSDDFSLMDIAYAYRWKRDVPLKLFYRIYKHNRKFKLIERVLKRQPYVKLSNDLKEAVETGLIKHKSSETHPRHDLKIIIAKKSGSRGGKIIGVGNNKIKLNKPNGNGSKVLSDFERLRGEVDNVQFTSSDFVSTSEMKTTLSKKSGTVSHHDLKLENKSSTKKQQQQQSNDSHDYYDSIMNEREKEKCYSRRESTKHHAKSNEIMEKFKASSRSNLSLNVPKLKIELPSLKTKISVPRTPTDTYVISSPTRCETPMKKVRFDISTKDSNDEAHTNIGDQTEYAARIGLKPVERKVESIILHRKRKKSKHSREGEHSKRPKLHVSSSLDESLKLKLKIMGGKSCKSDKRDEAEKATCNLRAVPSKTLDLTSINVQDEKQRNIREKQQQKEASDVVENHKYSVTEQKNVKSGSNQPMVFIPKLVLQKTPSVSSSLSKNPEATETRNSFVVEQAKSRSTSPGIKLKVKSFESISASSSLTQNLMKPPTAKMGSPKQSPNSSNYSLSSPIRPQSIPASLKLSPILPPTSTSDFQLQAQNNLKRSLSLGAEKSSYLHTFIKPSKSPNQPSSPDTTNYSKIPPLIPSSSSFRHFYGAMNNAINKSQSQSKLPNINVKDPIKLFPNACPSVEILKIPQKTFVKHSSTPPTTIPLDKIRKSAQNPVAQKILPKPQMNQNVMKAQGFIQSPQCSSQTLNYSGIYQQPSNQDINLERYTLELTHDIAKLDRSLSLEKNFEHWEKKKLQEFSKLNDLKMTPMMTKNLLNLQQNLSVRNIPNPSAIMLSRNQSNSNFKNESSVAVPKAIKTPPQKETVTSTSTEQSDIEDILCKSTIAKTNERDFTLQKSSASKNNDKKSIEKLTEFLRLTAAKSKDAKHDDDNNNNNDTSKCDESTSNNRNFKSDKFISVNVPSVDVICIDS